METITPATLLGLALAAAGAISTLGGAANWLVKFVQALKAPNAKQDERLDAVENDLKEVHRFLDADKSRLDAQDESNRVTQQALLALLAHGIDGNHVEQMETAKAKLENHLINR